MKMYQMKPYDLGETNDKEAIKYLINYLKNGTSYEKALAASGIRKLSLYYKDECNECINILLDNLNNNSEKLRQYSLLALGKLDLTEENFKIIKCFYLRENNSNIKRSFEKVIQKYEDRHKNVRTDKFNIIKYKIKIFKEIIISQIKYFFYVRKRIDNIKNKSKVFKISDKEILEYYKNEKEISISLKDGIKEVFTVISILINLVVNKRISIDVDRETYLKFYDCFKKYIYKNEKELCLFNKKNNILKKLIVKIKIKKIESVKSLIKYVFNNETKVINQRLIIVLYYAGIKNDVMELMKIISLLLQKDINEENLCNQYKKWFINKNSLLSNSKKFEEQILKKIQWPNNPRKLDKSEYIKVKQVRSVKKIKELPNYIYSKKMRKNIEFESGLEKKVLLQIEASNKVIYYQVQPFYIKYTFNEIEHNYIPDIFIVLEDGKNAIIEVKNPFDMALTINREKYKALIEFCNTYKCGYIMTSGRVSFDDIKRINPVKEFENYILNRIEKGPIIGYELFEINKAFDIKSIELTSVIINNNLYYQKEPKIIVSKNLKDNI